MKRTKLGATGTFPEGKLTPDDKGGVVLSVSTEKGHVMLNFGIPVRWLGIPPDQALELAQSLKDHAQAIQARKKLQ